MSAPVAITYRTVPGQWNQMAVCSACSRDASEVRMSWFVQYAIEQTPLLCDDCKLFDANDQLLFSDIRQTCGDAIRALAINTEESDR